MRRHDAPPRSSVASQDQCAYEQQEASQHSVDAVRSARGESLLVSDAEDIRPSENVGRKSIQEYLGIRHGVMSVEVFGKYCVCPLLL